LNYFWVNNIFTIVIDEIKLNEKSRNDLSELINNENDILIYVFFDNLKNENVILYYFVLIKRLD
jgi:hypothetical protein